MMIYVLLKDCLAWKSPVGEKCQLRKFKIMGLIVLLFFSCPVTGLAPRPQIYPFLILTCKGNFSHYLDPVQSCFLVRLSSNIIHVWNHPTSSPLISLFSCGLRETLRVCRSYKRSIGSRLFKNDELVSHADRKAIHNQRYLAGGKEGNQISAD